MIPRTISASSLMVFMGCEARYKAENIDRAGTQDNTAALLGTACHAVLEQWVKDGWHLKDFDNVMERDAALNVLWNVHYYQYLDDQERFAEGWQMLLKWVQNIDFTGRTVLSTEVKTFFLLPTSAGPLQVTYIWDRCDRTDDGDIIVVDYKSVIQPIQPDELKKRIQPRLYALAAAIQFKEEGYRDIWVEYDLLRYERVSVRFTREENEQTWKWLLALAERIIASDGTAESLNPECRYCVRKTVCKTLKNHGDGGGILAIGSLADAVDRRAKMDYARAALNAALTEMDDLIMTMAEEEGVGVEGFTTENTEMYFSSRATRKVEDHVVAGVVGPEIMQKYGKMDLKTIDSLLKTDELTSEQKSQLKQSIRKQSGKLSIRTKPKSSFEED